MHLRPGHTCAEECSSSCPQWRYERALEAPLPTAWQIKAAEQMHERIRARREALMRGDIPA